jgi:quinoprotein glucose dehydrogenase
LLTIYTGESILTFGKEGVVDIREGLGREVSRIETRGPATIFENIMILGSFPGEGYVSPPGHTRAYNVITGDMVWIFHTIPQPGEYGYETWPKDAYKYTGGVNNWGAMSVDEEREIVYIPIGSPTYDYYGADRIGSNLFGNCLLALDIRTGKRIWHFQTVHHDLWDYDLATAPQLITVNKNGKCMDAVSVATKSGFMFAFERETGEPLWPIEERPVPASNMPGEEAWPTQPFPTHIPPYTKQEVDVEDISPILLSEEDFEKWKVRTAKASKSIFTPPDTTETITMPGATGGANWGNVASNPDKGLVYVLSKAMASYYQLKRVSDETSPRRRERAEREGSIQNGTVAYEKHCIICHGADLGGNAIGPSLLTSGSNMNLRDLKQIVQNGLGRMPGMVHVEDEEIENILNLLRDKTSNSRNSEENEEPLPEGPVVASGGAPGQALLKSGRRGGSEYPEGVDVPAHRYTTGYGQQGHILNPPWSSITAYDMNQGTIKWTRPLGEHPEAIAKGEYNTGVPSGSSGQGMVVTSNGLIFATVTNGQVYAFDADNGDILWKTQTNQGISTLSSMYEVNGKIYFVVNATSPKKQKNKNSENQFGEYVVFSLPQ